MAHAIILGSGTSNGVPMLGMEYAPEYLASPKNHRTRCSVLLVGPEGNFLIDCAPELRLQVVKAGITRIDAVLITHTHADHVMGMDDLRSISMKTGRAIPVYAKPGDQADIRRIFAYAFQEYPEGVEVPRFDLREVPETIACGGLSIDCFTVLHGQTPVIGVRVNNFAYVTDVSEIPPEAEARLQNLNVLVLDAVRFRPHPNHFHYEKAIEAAQRIGAKTTYFTHLSHDYDHDKTEAAMPSGIRLAYDGLRIPL